MSNFQTKSLYIGVTSDIEIRVLEHKYGIYKGFTSKYKIKFLLYYERHPSMMIAIEREKQLKRWKRSWKLDLIKIENPDFSDLSKDWYTQRELDEFTDKRS